MLRVFKNGNINVQFSCEEYCNQLAGRGDLMSHLTMLLCDELGLIPVSEPQSAGNWAVMQVLYSPEKDVCYNFLSTDLKLLSEGKTVKLYARKPEERERF